VRIVYYIYEFCLCYIIHIMKFSCIIQLAVLTRYISQKILQYYYKYLINIPRSLDESRDPLKPIDTTNTHIPQKYISPTSKYATVPSRFKAQIETKADLSSMTDDTFVPQTNITSHCKYANLPSRLMDETTASTSAQKMKYEVTSSPRSDDSPRVNSTLFSAKKGTLHGQKRPTSVDEGILSGREKSNLLTPTRRHSQGQWKLTPEQHLIKQEKEKHGIKSSERISKLMQNIKNNEKQSIAIDELLLKVRNNDFRTEVDDMDINKILISDSEMIDYIPCKVIERRTSIKIEKSPYARGKTTPTHTPRTHKTPNTNGEKAKFVSQISDILVCRFTRTRNRL
jgi:hypothetical protein